MRGIGRRKVRVRIRRCIRHRSDDCDSEKYIGIDCFLALLLFLIVFRFCCLCDVFCDLIY
jgi:hypothetical protein